MVIPVLQNSSQAVAQSRTVSEASAQTATLSVDSERTNKVRADASREAAPGTSTVPAASGSTTDLLSRLGLDKSVPDRLIELGPKAYGQVLDVLKSDGNEARLLAAVETARKSSHDSFVEPLFGLLKVSDKPEVREACAEALTDLMKNCSCDEEERALLKSLLTAPEGSASLKRSVLSLLITTGEEQVLLDATLDPVLEEEHRISAASGLAELGMSRQSISSLAKELQNPALTPGMQNALAGALTAYSPSVAFKTAMQAFESPEVNEERSLGAALVLSYMEAQGMLTEEWVAEVGCQIEKIMQSPAASLLSDALLSRVLAPMGRQYAGDLLRSWVLSNSGSDPVDSAVRALHQIDPEAGSELLTELAVNPGNQFYQRIEALKLMAERPTEANRAILLAGMRDPQVMTYSLPAVIGNLSEAGGPVATSLLRELLADPAMTHNLRSQAMRGLSVCGQPSDFELIRSFARDNTTFFYDVHNLIESADTMLNRHGNNIPGITEALRETLALEAADRFQQLALRAMLLRLGEKDVLPGLRKQLLEDEFACRATYAAVAALGAERDASSIYTLNRLASDPARASDVRLEAIIAVGELPEKECREILRPLLRDPIESLRLEAAAILWRRDTDEAAMKVLGGG